MCVNRLAVLTWPTCVAWIVSIHTSVAAFSAFVVLSFALHAPALWNYAVRVRTNAEKDVLSSTTWTNRSQRPDEPILSCTLISSNVSQKQEDLWRVFVQMLDSIVPILVLFGLCVCLCARLMCIWSGRRTRRPSDTCNRIALTATRTDRTAGDAGETDTPKFDAQFSNPSRRRNLNQQIMLHPKDIRLAAAIEIVVVTNILVDGIHFCSCVFIVIFVIYDYQQCWKVLD